MLMNAYCSDIFYGILLDGVKLQTCAATKALMGMHRLIPSVFQVFEVSHFNFIDYDKSYMNKVKSG